MKFLSLIILMLTVAAASAGTIVGTVRAEGRTEPGGGSKGGKYDSRKFKFVERIDYSELKDFIVYIDQPVTNARPETARTVQVVTQRDAAFQPHVLPVLAGTTVEWPNKDEIFHNVFSISESNPFDLGLYKDPEVKKVRLQKPGRVDVFCSIHSQMYCIVLVLQNPFYAAADKNGKFRIENVPPGTYQLKAWHERLPAEVKEITVPETGEVEAQFTLGIKGLPKY